MPVMLWDAEAEQWVSVSDVVEVPEPPSGWPDATNTGIAGVGLTLADLTVTGGMTANTDGQIIQNRRITDGIVVNANNVTIRRCYIEGFWFPIDAFSASGLTVEDCTIVGGQNCGIGAGAGATIRRCDISDGEDGIKGTAGLTVEDCYIHDLAEDPDAHNDSIQMFGEMSNIIIRRNWLDSPDTSNIAMFVGQVLPGSNILIEANHLRSGGFNIYFPGTDASNVRVLNNVFAQWGFGPASDWWPGGGNLWSGNTTAGGSPLPAPS